MEYVEILRARRFLTWYTGLIVAGLIIEAISYYAGHGHNEGNGTVAFSSLAGAASFGALIIATLLSPGLSAEAANTTALIWTRPAPRDAIASRFLAVDAVAILIAYAILLVGMLIGIAIVGGLPQVTFDPPSIVRSILLGLGGTMMWYAMISIAAARLPGRGPLLAGLSWGVFPLFVALVHAHFPVWLHDVVYALNLLNPVAWMGGTSPQGNSSFLPYSVWTRTLGAWTIAIVALVASVRLWSTREA